jgi:hypothetical protein
MVSLRIAPQVLAAYRATGKGWQGRMHQTLPLTPSRPAPPPDARAILVTHPIAWYAAAVRSCGEHPGA